MRNRFYFISFEDIVFILIIMFFLFFEVIYSLIPPRTILTSFVILIIFLYWKAIRDIENKETELLNQIFDIPRKVSKEATEVGGIVTQPQIDKIIELEKKPLQEELIKLEQKRKFYIDKFAIVNFIISILLSLLIN
jgi:hypothetical protein